MMEAESFPGAIAPTAKDCLIQGLRARITFLEQFSAGESRSEDAFAPAAADITASRVAELELQLRWQTEHSERLRQALADQIKCNTELAQELEERQRETELLRKRLAPYEAEEAAATASRRSASSFRRENVWDNVDGSDVIPSDAISISCLASPARREASPSSVHLSPKSPQSPQSPKRQRKWGAIDERSDVRQTSPAQTQCQTPTRSQSPHERRKLGATGSGDLSIATSSPVRALEVEEQQGGVTHLVGILGRRPRRRKPSISTASNADADSTVAHDATADTVIGKPTLGKDTDEKTAHSIEEQFQIASDVNSVRASPTSVAGLGLEPEPEGGSPPSGSQRASPEFPQPTSPASSFSAASSPSPTTSPGKRNSETDKGWAQQPHETFRVRKRSTESRTTRGLPRSASPLIVSQRPRQQSVPRRCTDVALVAELRRSGSPLAAALSAAVPRQQDSTLPTVTAGGVQVDSPVASVHTPLQTPNRLAQRNSSPSRLRDTQMDQPSTKISPAAKLAEVGMALALTSKDEEHLAEESGEDCTEETSDDAEWLGFADAWMRREMDVENNVSKARTRALAEAAKRNRHERRCTELKAEAAELAQSLDRLRPFTLAEAWINALGTKIAE